MDATRHGVWVSLIAALLLLSGCGVFVDTECASPRSWERLDEALGACVPSESALVCSDARSLDACAVGQGCDVEAGYCDDDAYEILILRSEANSLVVQGLNTILVYEGRRVAQEFEKRGLLSKPVRVRSLWVDKTSDTTFAQTVSDGVDSRTLVILAMFAGDLRKTQESLLDQRVLALGQFSNSTAFQKNEQWWDRYTYGLIPSPIADIFTWSSFLSARRTEGRFSPGVDGELDLDARLAPRCSKIGVITSRELTGSFRGKLLLQGFTAYPGLSWGSEYVLVDPDESLDEAFEQMNDEGVDCVLLSTLTSNDETDEYSDVLARHRDWRTRRADGTVKPRWLLPFNSRLDAIRDELEARGVVSELAGALSTEYIVGGELSQTLFDLKLPTYAQTRTLECDRLGDDVECPWMYEEDLRALNAANRFSVAEDQVTLALLAAAHAERRSLDGNVTRESLRQGFLSLVSRGPLHRVHDRDGLSECVRAMEQGSECRYFGVSSQLRFGDDGRSETYDERMLIREFDGSTWKVLRDYTHEEMVERYKALQ